MGKYMNLFKIVYLILLLFFFCELCIRLQWLRLYSAPVESLVVYSGWDDSMSHLVSLLSKTCSKLEES